MLEQLTINNRLRTLYRLSFAEYLVLAVSIDNLEYSSSVKDEEVINQMGIDTDYHYTIKQSLIKKKLILVEDGTRYINQDFIDMYRSLKKYKKRKKKVVSENN